VISPSYQPTASASRILVTSALPYANGPIHFGHIAGAYLPADIYVRTQRARGRDVVYICGTDEHGVAITLTAQQAGVTPREHVDRWHKVICDIFQRFDIVFDHFSRTSTDLHAANSREFFRKLLAAGYVKPLEAEQLYCARDERFLPDRYVTGTCYECDHPEARGDECPRCGTWIEPLRLGDPTCRLCGSTPEKRATRHWYLMLDKLQPELEKYIGARGHWKRNVLQFVGGLLKEGLHPRPITRDLNWGIPVPLEEAAGKVIYVWFDAPIGYITATQEWAAGLGTPERWKDYWQDPETRLVHFIGKDNIPFHCLTFPAMLMGQEEAWKLADDVPANEFFNLEGGKFNTSAGWYIDLDDFFSKYTTDMIRWSIARNLPETADAEFTWHDFQAKVNGELADIYGNLAHRVMTFIHRYFDGRIPAAGVTSAAHEALATVCRESPEKVATAVDAYRLREASVEMMNLARAGNRYFDAEAPWKSRKENPDLCAASLNRCVRLLETLAVISAPFIPSSARRLWAMLGRRDELAAQQWDRAGVVPDPAGRTLGRAEPLFSKISDDQVAAEIAALGRRAAARHDAGTGKDRTAMNDQDKRAATPEQPEAGQDKTPSDKESAAGLPALRPEITIDDFLKCDFRLGRIVDAEKVPGSRKLIRFTVDIGLDTRTILAGIQEHYDPETLVGKTVVVIANLAPRRMMGYDSQGMILAAEVDGTLTVLAPLTEGLRPGAQLS